MGAVACAYLSQKPPSSRTRIGGPGSRGLEIWGSVGTRVRKGQGESSGSGLCRSTRVSKSHRLALRSRRVFGCGGRFGSKRGGSSFMSHHY